MLAARGARLLSRAFARGGVPVLSPTPAVFMRHMAGRGSGASSADSSFTLGDASSDDEARRSAAAAAASSSAPSAAGGPSGLDELSRGSAAGSGSDSSSGFESYDEESLTPQERAALREQQLREIKQLQAEMEATDMAQSDTDDGITTQKRVRLAVGPATGSVRRIDAAVLLGKEPTDEEDSAPAPRAARAGAADDTDDDIVDIDLETASERLDVDPALRRRAYKQALYQRRNTRAHLAADEEQLDEFAAAFAREHAHEIELTDMEEITRPTDYVRGTGQDPLEPPESRKQDRRVRMEAHVPTLLPGDKTAAAYVRAIAGSHYRAKTDQLIISCDKHVDTGMNRREILEKLVTLVSEAQRLGREYGPFPRIKRLPQYTH